LFPFGLIGAVAVGALGVRLLDRGTASAASPRRESELTTKLAALEESSAADRERLARLERQGAPRPPVASPKVAASDDADDAEERRSAEPAQNPTIRTNRELAEAYRDRFEAEEIDTAWARSAEAQYRPIIDAQLPATSRVESLECRSAFCKLEVVHESIESSNGFLEHLFMERHGAALKDIAGGFRAAEPTPTADGKLNYVVYIGRPGVSVALAEAPPPSQDP
jgi:hypothetical protein